MAGFVPQMRSSTIGHIFHSIASEVHKLEDPNHINPDSVKAHQLRTKLENFRPPTHKLQPPFKRAIITHAGEIPTDDSDVAYDSVIGALFMREKYMAQSLQSFPKVVAMHLDCLEGELSIDELTETLARNTNQEGKISTCHDLEKELPPHVEDPWNIKLPSHSGIQFKMSKGIVQVYEDGKLIPYKYPSFEEHVKDLTTIYNLMANGPVRTFCEKRINLLRSKYDIHVNLNETFELSKMQEVPHKDFYNVMKVDTHIHSAGAMTAQALLKEISVAYKADPNAPVLPGKNKGDPPVTLAQMFEKLMINPNELSVDMLDVQTDNDAMNRFDVFNSKYNPMGDAGLRKVFLKTSNLNDGKYYANVLQKTIDNYERNGSIFSELRNGAGSDLNDWIKKSKWAIDNNLYSDHVRYGIQIARTYDASFKSGEVKSFEEFLDGTYTPIFLATAEPNKYPEIAKYLEYCWGFDSVDDESKPEEPRLSTDFVPPDEWTTADNPSYAYYLYYMYANLCVLNQLRRDLGLHLFTLRPHCGESGSIYHLASSFLLSENISHGIVLRESPTMEYLYYLAQIPIAMSPLSNNALFLPYTQNPLKEFFAEGIPITVSTDDPLMFHMTLEPLLEEYAIAKQVFRLSTCDLCEMARNSVLMCGFPDNAKKYFIGENYTEPGVAGNDIGRSNIPNVRVAYRTETLMSEMYNLCCGSSYYDKIKRSK